MAYAKHIILLPQNVLLIHGTLNVLAVLSLCSTPPRSLHVEQHVVRLFQHSLEDGQPLCSNSAVDHSVVTAEGDTHHIGHLEAVERVVGVGWGCRMGVREVKRSR